jgi:hypothetical protein
MKTKRSTIKTAVCVLIGLTCFASAGVSFAQNRPTYQRIVIDPDPTKRGADRYAPRELFAKFPVTTRVCRNDLFYLARAILCRTLRVTLLEKQLVDINGDGKLDAVLGATNPGGLYWYEAPSSGRLSDPWIKHTIAFPGYFYEGSATFDVNGDGAPDIIASVDNKLVWFENPLGHGGDPAIDPWPIHVIRSNGGAHEIVLGDIDRDGKIDVICSSSGELKTTGSILFQNTPDSWTEVHFGAIGEGVVLLDIGAGLGKINVAGGDGDSIVWYENPHETGGDARKGTWIRHVAARLSDVGEDSFATGVFSSAGHMDLIVASNEDYPANPSGLYRVIAPADRRSAWTLQTIDPTYYAVHRINVADMNNDGTPDLVISEGEQAHNTAPDFNQNFNKQRVAIFYNDGDGKFTPQIIGTSGGHNQAVGDVAGNGKPAILSANHGYFGAPTPLELWIRSQHPVTDPVGAGAVDSRSR